MLALALFAPGFYQGQPLLSLLTRQAPALVVACGMGLVIVSRQINISVGSQFAVCSVCAGLLAAARWPPGLMVPAVIGLGAAMGAFNGGLVAGLRLPSIVVTLATMVAWREGLRWLRQGLWRTCPRASSGSDCANRQDNGPWLAWRWVYGPRWPLAATAWLPAASSMRSARTPRRRAWPALLRAW